MIEEMESYRDDRSEEWKQSERAGEFQEVVDRTEEALTIINEIYLG
jgi:hypothetical protein